MSEARRCSTIDARQQALRQRSPPSIAVIARHPASNEFFALLGPSGCGKTTLLRMLAGFETPSDGRILLDGRDMTAIPPNRRPVNMMFQSYALFPHMSVAANVSYGLEAERLPARGNPHAASTRSWRRRSSSTLADAPARAIVGRPEAARRAGPRPGQAAAPAAARRAARRARQEAARADAAGTEAHAARGRHHLRRGHPRPGGIAGRWPTAWRCSRDGRLLQCDTPHAIYEHPADRFVADFIGLMNFLPGRAAADGVADRGLAR